MSETAGALVPLEQEKRNDFQIWGDQDIFEYSHSYLTEAQRQLLADRVEFTFVFGAHGTDPENFLEVEKIFDKIDPKDSVICFENAGFSLEYERQIREKASTAKTSDRMKRQREAVLKSRNSVGRNYMTATDAFYYAQEFCLANGFDVHFADIDRWTQNNLIEAFKADGYENDPVYSNEKLYREQWKNFSLIEAVEEWKRLNNISTVLIDGGGTEPIVIPRWGRYHAIREEYAVNRVLSLALRKLENDDASDGHKLQMFTFFGTAHTKGIQQRFSDRGVGMKTIQTYRQPILTVAEDTELCMQDVRSFMASWSLSQLYQHIPRPLNVHASDNSSTFDDQVEATKRAVELMPSDSLFELYESFRTAVNYYDQPASEDETPLSKAVREFKSQRVNPSVILQKLLVDAMHKNGMTLEEATKQYVAERSRALAELFGRQTVNFT